MLILASDLRPCDVGAEVAVALEETVRGRLDGVSHVGTIGRTTLVIEGTEHVVGEDFLVGVDLEAAVRILGQPGRSVAVERARRVAELRYLVEGVPTP